MHFMVRKREGNVVLRKEVFFERNNKVVVGVNVTVFVNANGIKLL